MSLTRGDTAASFTAGTSTGKIRCHDWIDGFWLPGGKGIIAPPLNTAGAATLVPQGRAKPRPDLRPTTP